MSTTAISCPNCGYSKEIPTEKLPKRPTSVGCPSCKKHFNYSPQGTVGSTSTVHETSQPAPSKTPPPSAAPARTSSAAPAGVNSGSNSANFAKPIILLFILLVILVGGRLWLESKAQTVPYPYWLSASQHGVAILYGEVIYVVDHDGIIQQKHQVPENSKPCQISWQDDELWVADWKNDEIIKFIGEQIVVLSLQGPPIESHLNIAVDKSNDRLFIVDSQASRIAIYDSDGTFIDDFGRKGHAKGNLFFPKDIAFDDNGQLIVGNTLRAGIDVFTTTGTFVETITEPKGKSGYNFLTDFAVHQQNLITLECNQLVTDCVVASYDRSGNLLETQPQLPGAEAAGDVAIWDGTAYVSDCLNRRVLSYSAATLEPLGSLSKEIDDIGEKFNKQFSLYKLFSNLSLVLALVCLISILVIYKRSKSN